MRSAQIPEYLGYYEKIIEYNESTFLIGYSYYNI